MRRGLAAAALACVLAAGAARSGPEARAERAHVDWMLQCQGCHLADGTGMPGEVPSLVGVARYLTVPGGRTYLARVPGAALSPLDDAALAAVLNWMLHRFGPADVVAAEPPYTAAEVAPLRRTPLVDVETPRAALHRALGDRQRE